MRGTSAVLDLPIDNKKQEESSNPVLGPATFALPSQGRRRVVAVFEGTVPKRGDGGPVLCRALVTPNLSKTHLKNRSENGVFSVRCDPPRSSAPTVTAEVVRCAFEKWMSHSANHVPHAKGCAVREYPESLLQLRAFCSSERVCQEIGGQP